MARQNPENLIIKLGFLGLGALGIWLAFRKQQTDKEEEAVQLVRRQQKLIDTRTEQQKQLAVEQAVAAAASPFIPAAASFVAGKRGSRSGKRSYISGGKAGPDFEFWMSGATLGSKSWDDMSSTERGNDCMERLRVLHDVRVDTKGNVTSEAINRWPASMKMSIKQAGSFKDYKKALYRCVENYLGAEAYLRVKNMYGKASMLPAELGILWVYPTPLSKTRFPDLYSKPCAAEFVKRGYTPERGFDENMFYDPWGPGCPGVQGTWRGEAWDGDKHVAPVERQKAWQAYYYEPRLFRKEPTKSKPSWAEFKDQSYESLRSYQ